jgi:hypothetical protein
MLRASLPSLPPDDVHAQLSRQVKEHDHQQQLRQQQQQLLQQQRHSAAAPPPPAAPAAPVVEVTFSVHYSAPPGAALAVVGDALELGAWQPAGAARMTAIGGDNWAVTIPLASG